MDDFHSEEELNFLSAVVASSPKQSADVCLLARRKSLKNQLCFPQKLIRQKQNDNAHFVFLKTQEEQEQQNMMKNLLSRIHDEKRLPIIIIS